MPETCFYTLDYQYHSNSSFAFDEMHATEIVEAPKDICFKDLETLCRAKIHEDLKIDRWEKIDVVDITEAKTDGAPAHNKGVRRKTS